MNPIALLLLILGYGLALPILARLREVIRNENRLALFGHQIGVSVAALGWITGNRAALIWIHMLWLLVVTIWFNWANRQTAV